MARKTRGRIDVNDSGGFGGSFGELLRAQGLAPEATADPAPDAPAPAAAPADAPADTRRARLRMERAGRRGKTVTLIEQVEGSPAALKALAKAAGKALGCGATVEADVIVVQGDQRERLTAWLATR